MESCYLQSNGGIQRTAGSERPELYIVLYTCEPKEKKRAESTIAVIAVLGCHLTTSGMN